MDSDDETGMAIRPVEGVPIEKIDGILQEMVSYNNKMSPYYMPRTSVEEVDGKQVLVIWCPAGINRPYSVPEKVTAKNGSKEYFYIRSGSSSIIAKGEVSDELRELLISKRYRNRRLGGYLKELEMTEGRSTGIPTIQNVLKANGSPRAVVVTDEERTFFRITIPCHEAAGNVIADIATREKIKDSSQEMVKNIPDVLKDVLKDVQKDVLKELSERQMVILEMIYTSPEATLIEMSRKLKVSDKTIQREFTAIRKLGINIERQDGRKEGKWIIMTEGKE